MSNKILIRYNTADKSGSYPWRVFIDGVEHLASEIDIFGHTYGELSYDQNGVRKYNIACDGNVTWAGTAAIIKTERD